MRKEFSFENPELILLLTDSKKSLWLEKYLQQGLDLTKGSYTALSLIVEKKHIKNMRQAIKLMDVTGLYVTGRLEEQTSSFADIKTSTGPYNNIYLKNGKYHATSTLADAYSSVLKKVKPSAKIAVIGNTGRPKILRSILLANKFKGSNIKSTIKDAEIVILCGTGLKLPRKLRSSGLKASIIDLREDGQTCKGRLLKPKKMLVTSARFLSHLISENVRAWTSVKIDPKRLEASIIKSSKIAPTNR